MSKNKDLYDFCNWNETKYVQSVLSRFNNLDVLYEEGILFRFAISKGNSDICGSLLKYFDEVQFPIKNKSYEEAKEKLTDILENATDGVELSQGMKEVLAPYIDFEGSIDERLNDSFLDEITIPFENETLNSSEEERNLAGNNEVVTNHNSEVISH